MGKQLKVVPDEDKEQARRKSDSRLEGYRGRWLS